MALSWINEAPNETRTQSLTIVSEFESNWLLHSFGFVPYLSQKSFSKLLNARVQRRANDYVSQFYHSVKSSFLFFFFFFTSPVFFSITLSFLFLSFFISLSLFFLSPSLSFSLSLSHSLFFSLFLSLSLSLFYSYSSLYFCLVLPSFLLSFKKWK